MTQILSPAGSPEAVIAAVQSGADAIYLGLGDFNARRGAKNFTEEEFQKAVRYCHIRGCKVFVTLNTLISDREMESALALAQECSRQGVDGVIVQDLGLLRLIRETLPDLPVHASTQMSIHNLAGVQAAAEMGVKCAVLARELKKEQIREITQKATIETEVFVHGALCVCHSGQCYMSSMIGRRSGNRGMCAQPCRMQYSLGGRMDDYPLSLKDNCLADKVGELEEAGVAYLKIEGRMKRPEYTAVVTDVYSKVLKEHRRPTPEENELLERTFSRDGFTQGYYDGTKKDMHGTRGEPEKDVEKLYSAVRKRYAEGEMRRVPIHFYTVCRKGEPIKAIAFDDEGHKAAATGPIPERAKRLGLTEQYLEDQMYKTGGTPYYCVENRAQAEEGLFLSASEINELRRSLITKLSEERAKAPERRELPMPGLPLRTAGSPIEPVRIFQVLTADQLTPELADMKPDYLYVPMLEMQEHFKKLTPFIENGTRLAVVLPRVITDDEYEVVGLTLKSLFDKGVNEALVGNIGHILYARRAGMKIRADFGMNVFNSYSMEVLRDAGFLSATASFELRLAQIKDLVKCIDTEMIVYGRLPLMVSDQCIISHSAGRCNCQNNVSMSDRKGSVFPVVKEFGCRNVIYNAHKLYMADKAEEVAASGVWGIRLMFTNESPRECVEVAKGYFGQTSYEPNVLTRGLYLRGVE